MAVEAVNRTLGLVLMVGGTVYPVDTWLDCDGNECDEPDAVFFIVQGCDGRWHTLELSEFETVRAN